MHQKISKKKIYKLFKKDFEPLTSEVPWFPDIVEAKLLNVDPVVK